MFEKSKDRYLTRGVDAEIPLYLQMFLWDAVDNMPQPKDYLQVFRLSEENGLDRKSTRLNSSHKHRSRMPSSA